MMAEPSGGDLCDATNDPLPEPLAPDERVRTELRKIETDYESVFSWDVKRLTGNNDNLMVNVLHKIEEECSMLDDVAFDLNRFCLKLMLCYELYDNKSYEKSLSEIESMVKFLESCEFGEVHEPYSDAYIHIVRATNAYVALTLNLDHEMIIKDIKPVNSLNQAERSAILAVKANVFMDYPPKGNDIALQFADQARNIHSTEFEWLIIWLKAKGRVRRYYKMYQLPDVHEMNAAEILSTSKTIPKHVIGASKLFMEVAFTHKINFNQKESNKYYKLSSDLLIKAVGLANDDVKLLSSCLFTLNNYPKQFHSKTIIDQIIEKLTNVKNSHVNDILGKYYLKHVKDYEKAKMYLSRAMASGHFSSSLQLIKVECLLQPVEKFPLVQTLKMIYDIFLSPKRRLIILSQILIYYYYYENNPKEMMHYLKLYMDQDIDDTLKKHHLIFVYPLFKVNGVFKINQFFYYLSAILETIRFQHKWSKEEKEIVEDTLDRFNKLSKIKILKNQFSDKNKTGFHKQNHKNNSSQKYPDNKYPYNNIKNAHRWPKYPNQYHSASKNISKGKVHEKNGTLNKELQICTNKDTENNSENPCKMELNNKNPSEHHEPNNNSNDLSDIEAKLKKFEIKHSLKGRVRNGPVINDYSDKFTDFRMHGQNDNRRPNWKNRQERSFQDNFCSKKKNYNNRYVTGNLDWRKHRLVESVSTTDHNTSNNPSDNINPNRGNVE